MCFEAWAGATTAAGVKAGDQAEVLAGVRASDEARAWAGSLSISTKQLQLKGGEQYATGRSNRPSGPGPENRTGHGKMRF